MLKKVISPQFKYKNAVTIVSSFLVCVSFLDIIYVPRLLLWLTFSTLDLSLCSMVFISVDYSVRYVENNTFVWSIFKVLENMDSLPWDLKYQWFWKFRAWMLNHCPETKQISYLLFSSVVDYIAYLLCMLVIPTILFKYTSLISYILSLILIPFWDYIRQLNNYYTSQEEHWF